MPLYFQKILEIPGRTLPNNMHYIPKEWDATLGSDKACLLKLWWVQWLPEMWCLENHISVLKLNFTAHESCSLRVILKWCKQHHQEPVCRKCAPHVPGYQSNLQCSSYYDAFILLWWPCVLRVFHEGSGFDNQTVVRRLPLPASQGASLSDQREVNLWGFPGHQPS